MVSFCLKLSRTTCGYYCSELFMRNVTQNDAVSLLNVTGAINDIALAERDNCTHLGKHLSVYTLYI